MERRNNSPEFPAHLSEKQIDHSCHAFEKMMLSACATVTHAEIRQRRKDTLEAMPDREKERLAAIARRWGLGK